MRQSYLRRGGSDRKILEQMTSMENEALEKIRRVDSRFNLRFTCFNENLFEGGNAVIEAQTTILQEENRRLQNQLAALINSNNKHLQYLDDNYETKGI